MQALSFGQYLGVAGHGMSLSCAVSGGPDRAWGAGGHPPSQARVECGPGGNVQSRAVCSSARMPIS
ncbi:hypothetical protein GXY_01871 [Novacetimonas hansenii ATCC 23769]|uniref:Uncharacterized protein n=1 Tax=Novacetimonas hansenii ATCC 23769 TaxID=714995 RepID=D5QB83_NOVHA|nr:hypothetical protein GXY_01871 [Novacetimonas hansenii ATCC 23769]